MKKSQLRKIIRETINQTLNEQASCPPNGRTISMSMICAPNWPGMGQTCLTVNGGQVPQVGDVFQHSSNPAYHAIITQVYSFGQNTPQGYSDVQTIPNAQNFCGWECSGPPTNDCTFTGLPTATHVSSPSSISAYNQCNSNCPPPPPPDYEVDLQIEQCDGTTVPNLTGCIHLDGQQPTANDVGKVFALFQMGDKTPHIINGVTVTTTPCPAPTIFGSYVPACPGTSGVVCDSTVWANYSIWVTAWTTNPAFTNNTNPNQPCNHICQQINVWESNQMTAGPIQLNQLACKIDEGYNQSQIHGCNC